MVKLPTGEEPPKGYEGYVADQWLSASRDGVQITSVGMNQLTGGEIAELDALRARALKNFTETTGHKVDPLPIKEELHLAPEGKEITDKLLFRAYEDKKLVAYAHVITNWPQQEEWAIEQLLLDPVHRLHGIGSKLIAEIENVARQASVKATSILSLPSRPDSESFWLNIGYKDETDKMSDELGDVKDYVSILRKEI